MLRPQPRVPCYVYSFCDGELAIDFARETVTKVVELRSLPEPNWFMAMNQLVGAVRGALLATGRADTWGLSWPTQSISTPSPFTGSNTTHAVVVEILNANGISIAQQTVNLPFDWFIPVGAERAGTMIPRVQFNPSRVSFPNVDVNIIDDLSIRIVSINNIVTESAIPQLGIRTLPEHELNRIQSVTDNGLRTDNLRQFNIGFGHNHNRINGYSGTSTSIVIPFGVSLIDSYSGLRYRGLTSIRMPSSLVRIGGSHVDWHNRSGALEGNRLTSVTIPGSVTSIGYFVFSGNPLTRVTIGADVHLQRGRQQGSRSSASFPSSLTGSGRYQFFYVYNNNGRRAGTYVNTGGTNWAFSGQ